MIASGVLDQSVAIQSWFSAYGTQSASPSPKKDFSACFDNSPEPNNTIEVDVEDWSLSAVGLYRKFILSILRQAENSITSTSATGTIPQETATPQRIALSEAQRQAAIRLIDEWLADDSGYDEEVWPIVKDAIEENRLSYRKRFNE